jgi:hypothetical protein
MAGINLTSEVIAQWKREKDQLEREQAEIERKLTTVTEKIKAASILMGTLEDDAVEAFALAAPVEFDSGAEDMTAAVERIANEATSALSKSDLKSQLRSRGFPESRLGNYFYTVIKRLKDHDRISVLDDGRIWKKPK